MKLISLEKLCVLAVILTIIVIASGCSPVINGWSQESYRIKGFNDSVLKKERLGLLPVIVLESSYKKNSEANGRIPTAPYTPQSTSSNIEKEKTLMSSDIYQFIFTEILLSKIQTRQPDLKIIPPGEALKLLNNNELTGTYRKFKRDFPRIGFNSAMLKNFGKTLNCRYLLISQAIMNESKSEASITIIWTFGRKSVLRSVKFSGQIWDTLTGRQVWEGSGVGYNRLSVYDGSPLIEEMANQAVESLLKNIIPPNQIILEKSENNYMQYYLSDQKTALSF
ncbi:Curli production assembly/transport component CsgG [Candidatus Magnetomoraceae bacterium gMMP-15]